MTARCGPKCAVIFSSSTGIVAMSLSGRRHAVGQSFAPGTSLRQAEERPPAARADVLIVLGAVIHLVREAELALDDHQIVNHHRRRIGTSAAPAQRLLASRTRILVEADANLRRPLEDVEQL